MKTAGNAAPTLDALSSVQEQLAYVLQLKDRKTGEWKNVGKSVRGKTAAYSLLNEKKQEQPGERQTWRVIPKNEDDKYREGIKHGRKLSGLEEGWEEEEEEENHPPHRALIYLPDRI